MSSNGFSMFKNGRKVHVQEPNGRDFRPSDVNEPIDPARVVGVDTESFRWNGTLTTTMIPAHTIDQPVMLDLQPGDSPIVHLFDWLMPAFGQAEDRPSRTKQRSKETRAKRVGRPDGRDGRRESTEPLILVWYNAEYDLGRLFEEEGAILRAIAVGQDSYTVPVGPYSLEVVHMNPTGSAPSFEWYVRRDKQVLRLIGRDMWGYWKTGLDKTAHALRSMGVTAKIAIGEKKEGGEKLFDRDWTTFTEAEKEEIRIYALQDSKTTREIYLATVELLTQIDPRVIRKDGTIPASAPGAAAKIAFQKAFDSGDLDYWYRPPAWVCQSGLDAYAGGRVFCRRSGPAEHLVVRDINSAYPDAMRWLPDPARCKYYRVKPGRWNPMKFKGKWGTLTISGEGLSADYPALRVHDDTHDGRLRYVVGKFARITATIPEIMIGVASGRLRVDRIFDGCVMEGPVETSFLRAYIHMIHHIKNTAEKDSPLYLIAKLLMNSLYGKLIEVRELNRMVLGADSAYLMPRWEELLKPEFIDAIRGIYVQEGIDGLEELRDEMVGMPLQEGDGLPPEILLREVLASVEYSAGHYFLPLHAANVTGFVSAKLGLAAWATNSLQGDTDSIFHPAGMELDAYYFTMEQAGYPAPLEGLGAFSLECADVSGVLVKPKMYSLRSPEGKFKQAHHGIIRLLAPADRDSKEYLHEVMVALVEDGSVEYQTKPRPIRLKAFLRRNTEVNDGVTPRRKIQIGEFYSEVRKIALTLDPNLRRDADGYLRWREF